MRAFLCGTKIKKELEKKMYGCKKKKLPDAELLILKQLVDEDPNIYLD